MRQIKFRGMGINGEWYYGLLSNPKVNMPGGAKKDHWYISNSAGCPFAYEVRPETIGEFSGLKDCKKVEIYENDFVKCGYGIGRVVFICGAFMVKWIDDPEAEIEFLGLNKKARRQREDDEQFEVIGNFHQHPVLLTNSANQ